MIGHVLPITFIRKIDGANGRNWPGIVHLDPRAKWPAAVWAQEAWESLIKMHPAGLLRRTVSSGDVKRKMRRAREIIGHEVEVQAARVIYGLRVEDYRYREARAQRRGNGGIFDGYPVSDLVDAMKNHSEYASRFVSRYRRRIEKYRNV